jgi:hypothetical protein
MPSKRKMAVSKERLIGSPILKWRNKKDKINQQVKTSPSFELAKIKELVKKVAKKSKR